LHTQPTDVKLTLGYTFQPEKSRDPSSHKGSRPINGGSSAATSA
jgi:hypothetical protein